MANNELSGPVVSVFLIKWLLSLKDRKYSYRFIFIPETIGSIAYINKNLEKLKSNIFAGFNVTCVGDERIYSFLPSRAGDTVSDQFALRVLKKNKIKFKKYSWLDRGSDERQYCSPGVDLPIATIMRSKYGEYKEYHTSLDNINNVVSNKGLKESFNILKKILINLEKSIFPEAKNLCEPFLTKYKLINTISFIKNNLDSQKILNFISFCDGKNSLEDISEKCLIKYEETKKIFKKLLNKKIIKI